jgi:alkanesulfonate monooxygenase SsuD/methylene tetrahydromethanopterin reductase-like flavin-dependent oxidoreductase (luciferase family)
VILRGMTNKGLRFEGIYYRYADVPMELAPLQQPHPPLWHGIGRPDAVPWAAERRVNVVANLGGKGMRAITDRYRAEWAATGNPADELPLMGVSRHIVIAETRKEALERRCRHRGACARVRAGSRSGGDAPVPAAAAGVRRRCGAAGCSAEGLVTLQPRQPLWKLANGGRDESRHPRCHHACSADAGRMLRASCGAGS